MNYLKPTWLIQRSGGLPAIKLSVIAVDKDADEATCQLLGTELSPFPLRLSTVRRLCETGVQL